MVRLSSRGHFARAIAVVALLGASACTDDAVSPTAGMRETAQPLASHAAGHLNRGKYRDSSLPHATGRSGSATLSASAVQSANGVTYLTVASGSIYLPGVRGELAKVQIKVWGPDGEFLLTSNYQRPTTGGSHTFALAGIPAGSRIQVQANVRGIDRNRTDVVTVTETVKRPPALTTTIHVPGPVTPGVPTVVTATVRETNGHVGTTTSCVLYRDGVEVDRMDGVWVDAGDEVSCAFTTVFPRAGDYTLRVSLESASTLLPQGPPPSDEATVRVADEHPFPSWRAQVTDRTVTTLARYDLNWWKPDGSHKEYEQTTGESPRSQTISLTGTLARATVFPLARVELQLGSNAVGTFLNEGWTGLAAGLPDAAGQTCVSQMVPQQGGHFTLCSTGAGAQGSTTFGYTRFGGTVTYHSRGFSRTWDAVAGTETYWTWNDNPETYASGGQKRDLGTAVAIHLGVTDGFDEFTVDATVRLDSFDIMLSEIPYTCREESPYWLDGGVQTICEGRTERAYGWSGEAAG